MYTRSVSAIVCPKIKYKIKSKAIYNFFSVKVFSVILITSKFVTENYAQ